MKETIQKTPTENSPEINFNPEKNHFLIKGKSIPEDADRLYKPYKTWLVEYFKEKVNDCDFIFDLEYFNSSSTKVIFDLLLIMKEAIERGNKINIVWRYDEDDEELYNSGSELQDFIGVPINMECKEIEV